MSDWLQNGVVTNLSRLGERALEDLEAELRSLAETTRIALVLPALFSEFEGPAMPAIIEELQGADYLHSIIVALGQADRGQFRRAQESMAALPVPVQVLWSDGPRIKGILGELEKHSFRVDLVGKGRSVWLANGLALSDPEVDAVALHDCDILNYQREMLARLIYPIANRALGFEFVKAYYTRISGQLYGRVTRLFFGPMVQGLIRVLGHLPFLEFLASFRYPLSGEFALVRNLAAGVRFSPDWGLETFLLREVYHQTKVRRTCQVELADNYEHKHRSVEPGSGKGGLAAMTLEIARVLFVLLSQEGVVLSAPVLSSLAAAYSETARLAIEEYHALALINGIPYDRDREMRTVQAFHRALEQAIEDFQDPRPSIPLLAAWVRVQAAIPDLPQRLFEAVALDNQEM